MFRLLAELFAEHLVTESLQRFRNLFTSKRGVWPKSGFDDPVYKQNVRELIERNKRFEKAE